jgi:hypothetical protein
MEPKETAALTRVSRLVVVRDRRFLVFNDHTRIDYHHEAPFLLVWALCRALSQQGRFRQLGGVPIGDLRRLCDMEGLARTEASLETLWHDEVLLHRARSRHLALKWYSVTDLKSDRPPGGLTASWIVQLLQLIFIKVQAPRGSALHGNVKLFSVNARPEEILTFASMQEAIAKGFMPSGASGVTRYRIERGAIGYLDWRHVGQVDSSGTSRSTVRVKLVNLSAAPLTAVFLPLWADSPAEARQRRIQAWFRNAQPLVTEVVLGDTQAHKAEFLVRFPSPAPVAAPIHFTFSYVTPRAYQAQKECFSWFFDHPHCRYSVDLRFCPPWHVSSPMVFEGERPDLFPPALSGPRRVVWVRFFPLVGATYRLEFLLSRTDA